MALTSFSGCVKSTQSPKRQVTTPADFGALPYNIFYNNGVFTTDFDFEAVRPATLTEYFVDLDTGSDSANDGLSLATPFKTLSKAVSLVGSKTINVVGGTRDYNRLEAASGNINADVVIKGIDNGNGFPEVWQAFESQNWTANGAAWQASRPAMNGGKVFDKNNVVDGEYQRLELKGTEAEVLNATAQELAGAGGMWWTNNSVVVLRTFDDRDISVDDSAIKLCFTANSVENNGNHTTFIENISFCGGVRPFRIGNTLVTDQPKVYGRNAVFSYGVSDNGLDTNGVVEGYLENCTATQNERDGFNHSERLGIIDLITQVNCKGSNNGHNGGFSNNGSTIHKGGRLVLINNANDNNEGVNVHAVDDGTKLLILSGTSTDNRATNLNSKVCYGVGAGNETGEGCKAWIYYANAPQGTQEHQLRVYTGNTAYLNQPYTNTLNEGTIEVAPELY